MALNSTTPSPLAGSPSLQWIDEMTRNAKTEQQNALAQILAQNADTKYLKGFNLNGAMDKETFRSKVPLVTYDDIQPLIRRVADGDTSPILCADPISLFIVRLVDYTSFVDMTTNPDHYVIYWELQAKYKSANSPSDDGVLEQCCLLMEESFNCLYRSLRASDKMIGPLEIRVVKNGTFEKLYDYAISQGASISQYKVPRSVNSRTPMFDLLESRVVSKHFSPSLPHFSADERL
ncbi:hypothetical protein CASFOL_020058 [Castilleja foliolosa]|uniref:GH3 C-terminal domain-containing protein n=1 Tax=Castilleja foliolosa TaxID=1961234 RepID=A0ABD3CZS4_9LAMI